ncbi:MAG TPA: sigma factor, partial [Ilumatobacteraceae bacterium]|nr:sigma factor [Ilumatobacteraceae bacterium]
MRTNATPEEVADLVQRHFDGDAKALAELIVIFQGLVKAAARRVLRCSTDVDDAVQDTWLNFVRFGDRIADP